MRAIVNSEFKKFLRHFKAKTEKFSVDSKNPKKSKAKKRFFASFVGEGERF